MLTVCPDHDDNFATTRMWMTNELPEDIDDWPDGWVEQFWSRVEDLQDSEELEDHEVRELAERLVRERFHTLPAALEVL